MTPAELAAYGMSEDAWAESLAGRHNRQAIRDHAPAASNREARQHRLAERLARAEARRGADRTHRITGSQGPRPQGWAQLHDDKPLDRANGDSRRRIALYGRGSAGEAHRERGPNARGPHMTSRPSYQDD